MNPIVERFRVGRPNGVANVARDANGHLASWVENGFQLNIERYPADGSVRLILTKGSMKYVETLRFGASGEYLGSDEDQIPTVLSAELRSHLAEANQSIQTRNNSYKRGVLAVAGDSTAEINIFTSSGSQRKSSRGAANWMLALLGQPLDFQLQDDYALGGSTTAHFLNVQVPAILAAKTAGGTTRTVT